MNLTRPPQAAVIKAIRCWLALRRILPKRKCHTFGNPRAEIGVGINQIYVINLDREPDRWSNVKRELAHILDSSGDPLLNRTIRSIAIDGNALSQDQPRDDEIDPYYTLADQLFVEPQPQSLPTRVELNAPIRMSRAEIAVARSHINVWRQIAESEHMYALVLEDDAWFHRRFANFLDHAWNDIVNKCGTTAQFDILYLSFLEVKGGAPKTILSPHVFRPMRGLWHLSGYVLSRQGAEKLLRLLPCRGPVDLWINHQFGALDVRATRRSLISQRRDAKSSNSYSILPTLSSIGAITSEGASLFQFRPTEKPVFAFGPERSGLSSLAVALSMLGYRCCSDLKELPTQEQERLLEGSSDRVFDAYVNVGSIIGHVGRLRSCYPKAKFLLTTLGGLGTETLLGSLPRELDGADYAVIDSTESEKWRVICEHLRCAPPACAYPIVTDHGQRPIIDEIVEADQIPKCESVMRDASPWVIDARKWWQGIRADTKGDRQTGTGASVNVTDRLEHFDDKRWHLRTDTFTDNLALFRPENLEFSEESGATLFIRRELVGVRHYTAASLCSRDQYLFGRFEADLQVSNVPGVVTGFFLHRNSPRQEIDIEIAGNRPSRLLANVFFNPGSEGANFDYGYRGSPSHIDLKFDASKSSHRYAIEWGPCEIRWLVDDKLVHRRVIWNPTPIPDLPMSLHVNCWLSRSTQLAGRLNNRRLPTNATIRSIAIAATSVKSDIGSDHQYRSVRADCYSEV